MGTFIALFTSKYVGREIALFCCENFFKGIPLYRRIVSRVGKRKLVHMLKQKDVYKSYTAHVDTVYRVCRMFFRTSEQDAEDAVQTTFLKRIKSSKSFESTEHEKAWLIVVASNVCKDMLRRKERLNVSIENLQIEDKAVDKYDEMLECVMSLPHKYKTALYMHYYEDYTCQQIAKAMKKSEGTIWNYLHVGRKMVKNMIVSHDEKVYAAKQRQIR